MKKNMGKIDKTIRVIIAAVVLGLFFGGIIEGVLAYVLLAVAGIFVATSLINFCPLYSVCRINTKKEKA